MGDRFYRAFEEQFRGSRDLIKSRLRAYDPFITAITQAFRHPTALDLGCGRGEWLELLGEAGVRAGGVDLDSGMLEACLDNGLSVRQQDALAALKSLPDESLSLVSAFHMVEHIPFDLLREVLAEAHRALSPGGLLILETPNPENIVVGTSNFFMDPTHEKPIPCHLLNFLVQYAGFGRSTVIRLQEEPRLHQAQPVGIADVLAGVSPDYGVVGQKRGSSETLSQFDAAFARPYGLSLEAMATRYDNQAAQDRGRIDEMARLLEQTARRSDERASALEAEVAELRRLAAWGPLWHLRRAKRIAVRTGSAFREGRLLSGLQRRLSPPAPAAGTAPRENQC